MSAGVSNSSVNRREQEAVTNCLKATGGSWTAVPPDYANFSRAEVLKKLEQVRDAVLAETNAPRAEVEAAHDRSQYFVESSFDFYERKKDLGRRIERAFVVPVRSTRLDHDHGTEGSGYASESTPFCPLLDPARFGVSSEIRMRTIYGLPPPSSIRIYEVRMTTRRGRLSWHQCMQIWRAIYGRTLQMPGNRASWLASSSGCCSRRPSSRIIH